jgi:hypothetical protein
MELLNILIYTRVNACKLVKSFQVIIVFKLLTVKSDNRETLQKKISTAIKIIEAYDVDGRPIMRKDIY